MTAPAPLRLEIERELAAAFPGREVAGVDEAGRGPLAGPVFAAAVSLPADAAAALAGTPWAEVDDSKKLSPAVRGRLAEAIESDPRCRWGVGSASAAEIDALNILNATHLAMRRACMDMAERAGIPADAGFVAIVDGLPVKGLPCPSRSVVKGDARSLLVGAASILAKTRRDAYCMAMDREYPGYGFARHKGYGTRGHLEALARLGPCPEHRKSFAPVRAAWLPGFPAWPRNGEMQL